MFDFGYVIYNYGNIHVPEFSYGVKMDKYSRVISLIYEKKINPFVYYNRQGSLYENGKYPIDNYLIQTEEDIYKMIEEVIRYFKNEAIPYLESISDLKSLEEIINKNPTEPTVGVKGLILAKLVNNPNYEGLKQKYRQLFIDRQWVVQEDIDNLEKVILFLDSHSKEKLEEIVNKNKS